MDPITSGNIGLSAYLLFWPGSSRFGYKKKKSSWRADFNGIPPSCNHVVHDDESYYVCWGRPLRTQAEAGQIAKHWMDT